MAEVTAAPKKHRLGKILAIVAAALVALVAIALGAWGTFVGFERPLKAGDREVLVTFELLAEKVSGLRKTPDSEEIVRKAYIDGSYEVSYSYEDENLSMDSSVSHERSVRDASQLFTITKMALPAATKLVADDVTFVERTDLYNGGDQRYSAAIMSGGNPGGHVLLVRQEKNVFMLTLGGAFIGDPAEFKALVEPRLDAMKSLH